MNTDSPSKSEHVYLVRTAAMKDYLDRAAWDQPQAAKRLGISRMYFNQLVNGRRPLSVKMRRRFIESEVFADCDVQELWERVPADEFEARHGK